MSSVRRALRLFYRYFLLRRPADGPVRQSEFAMHLEPVDAQEYVRLLKVQAPSHRVLAHVTHQSAAYETVQLDLLGARAIRRLLVVAGVHGNEFAAALAVHDLLDDMRRDPELYAAWHV